ncbi:MAG: type II secretion system protein M [Pusillimonas sp.]|nr:type II secretion system protein M [Pusillimonas sp.]
MRSASLVQHGSIRWAGLSARERGLVGFCAAFVLLAMVWTLLSRPAMKSIDEARTLIPQLRADLVQIQTLVVDAKSLSRQVSGIIPDQQMRGALDQSLQSSGFARVQLLEERADGQTSRRWRIVFSDSSAADVLAWLSDVPYALRLQVYEADLRRAVVSGRSQPDRLSGEVVLQQPGEAAS